MTKHGWNQLFKSIIKNGQPWICKQLPHITVTDPENVPRKLERHKTCCFTENVVRAEQFHWQHRLTLSLEAQSMVERAPVGTWTTCVASFSLVARSAGLTADTTTWVPLDISPCPLWTRQERKQNFAGIKTFNTMVLFRGWGGGYTDNHNVFIHTHTHTETISPQNNTRCSTPALKKVANQCFWKPQNILLLHIWNQ